MYSFKVLTECPIIIALLFQIHRNHVAGSVPILIDPIIRVLKLQPAQQAEAHLQAAKSGKIYLGRAPGIESATLYSEFKSLQVKVLSFNPDTFVPCVYLEKFYAYFKTLSRSNCGGGDHLDEGLSRGSFWNKKGIVGRCSTLLEYRISEFFSSIHRSAFER
jgi:hypothetical protein